MSGEIVLTDNTMDPSEFCIEWSNYDFSLVINLIDGATLEQRLADKEAFNSCMEEYQNYKDVFNKKWNDYSKLIKLVKKNFDHIWDNTEYVRLLFTDQDPKEYIKNNPMLLSKKIVVGDCLDISDITQLNKISEDYKDISDKIYVSLDGNSNYISIDDCRKTMEYIKAQAEEIKKLNLSPMETIMYVYDQVRSRVYKYEDEGDKEYKSRDLTEVLFGDRIVCVGYSSLFISILHYLGINSHLIHLADPFDPKVGHVRTAIYIDDPKYNIHGVYYFDPTWDSKKSELNNDYLSSYFFFAKTRFFFEGLYGEGYIEQNGPIKTVDLLSKLKKLAKTKNLKDVGRHIKTLNYLARMANQEKVLDTKDLLFDQLSKSKIDVNKLVERANKLIELYDKEIKADTMVELLNNVRKIEYYQNPTLYPYSIDDMSETYEKSDWAFKEENNDVNNLFAAMMGEKKPQRVEYFRKYDKEHNLSEQIEQVKLVRTLRSYLNKKTT